MGTGPHPTANQACSFWAGSACASRWNLDVCVSTRV